MRKQITCLCAAVVLIFLSGFAGGRTSATESDHPGINQALTDVDEIYVRLLPDRVTQINHRQLKEQITQKISESGLEVVSAGQTDMTTVPELIVRVSVLKGDSAGPCVYHIQTSFARVVYLRTPRASMKAEVWRIDVPVAIADAGDCKSSIASAALFQADAFIAEWKRARTQKQPEADAWATPAAKEAAPQQQDEPKQASQRIEYKYVASKNSKVFHKATCRAAARISDKNLVGFTNQREAIASGRRPCKICNP